MTTIAALLLDAAQVALLAWLVLEVRALQWSPELLDDDGEAPRATTDSFKTL